MLDLKARVHFEEIEIAVLVDDEFDSTSAFVIHGLRQSDSLLAHRLAGRLVKEGRRRLFDDLLVATLDGAFAFHDINGIAMLVAEHLNFDVTRLGDELFDENTIIAEARLGFRLRGVETVGHFGFRPRDTHALAAAASRRLDHHRIADVIGDLDGFGGVRDFAQIARHRIDLGFIGELLGLDLVTHDLDGLDVRTDEGNAIVGERLGELRVFRQEAIARMHSLGAGLLAGGDDLVDHEVAFGRGRIADVDGFVRHFDMQRISIRARIDGHRLDAHLACRLDNAAGDFASVGDQDFLEHLDRPQSGMLSCFFHGFSTSLLARSARARASRVRVEWGMMTSSI